MDHILHKISADGKTPSEANISTPLTSPIEPCTAHVAGTKRDRKISQTATKQPIVCKQLAEAPLQGNAILIRRYKSPDLPRPPPLHQLSAEVSARVITKGSFNPDIFPLACLQGNAIGRSPPGC